MNLNRKFWFGFKGFGAISLSLALLLGMTLVRQTITRTEAQMNNAILNCEVEAISNTEGEIALSFKVRNPDNQPMNIEYFIPFTEFDLKAYADDGEIPIIQPAYDTGVQPMSLTIAASETARIETPIHLRFDPNIKPSGGDVPTQWTLRHVPTPVLLRVTLQLTGATVEPCEVHVVPRA